MTNPSLTSDQLQQFAEEGYLVLESILTDDELQPIRQEITSQIHLRALTLVKEGKLSRTYEEHDFDHRLAFISKETDNIALSIWNSQLSLPSFFGLISNPKLLGIASLLLNTDEVIASSVYRLRPKIPNYSYGEVPWHQDSGYFEPYCDRSLILTFWVPLTDSTIDRGCLYVLPKVHKNLSLLQHSPSPDHPYLEIHNSNLPPIEPIPVEVKKGGVLIMTNRTPHASFKNNTDIVRWGMDLRYQSAYLPTNANITRLEGEVIGDSKTIPGACYPPEPDFLVRSIKRPNQVVKNPDDFVKIRSNHKPQPVTKRWEGRDWTSHSLFEKTNSYVLPGS